MGNCLGDMMNLMGLLSLQTRRHTWQGEAVWPDIHTGHGESWQW